MIGQRQPRVRCTDHLAWVSQAPCVACYVETGYPRMGVQVAHLRMASLAHGKRECGKAEKPDDIWTTPICPHHHVHGKTAQHNVGEPQFWGDLCIDPFALCVALVAARERGSPAMPVIAIFAAEARKVRRQMEHGL